MGKPFSNSRTYFVFMIFWNSFFYFLKSQWSNGQWSKSNSQTDDKPSDHRARCLCPRAWWTGPTVYARERRLAEWRIRPCIGPLIGRSRRSKQKWSGSDLDSGRCTWNGGGSELHSKQRSHVKWSQSVAMHTDRPAMHVLCTMLHIQPSNHRIECNASIRFSVVHESCMSVGCEVVSMISSMLMFHLLVATDRSVPSSCMCVNYLYYQSVPKYIFQGRQPEHLINWKSDLSLICTTVLFISQ